MDLESECCAVEFVEDNEGTQVDDNKIKDKVDDYKSKDNGWNKTQRLLATDHSVNSDVKGGAQIVHPMHSPPPLPATTKAKAKAKGYGLKKWRRIKRDFDFVKDPTASMDSSKTMKRGLSGSGNPAKPEMKQNSEAPVAVNMLKNASAAHAHAHGFMMRSPSSDSRSAVDPSSKSSTPASMPKDLPAVYEKNQMKNLSGKGNSSQRVQQGKGRVESSKKARGERVKIDKENSHSSMESDSRSSNFVFMQEGPFSMTSNGKQSGNSINYDGENSDEAHEGEHQISEEIQTAYMKENSGEIDDLAAHVSWEAKEENFENHWPSPDQDPLFDSVLVLQSVQEALENEVQKLGEIGKEPTSLHDDSVHIKSVHMDSTFADQEIHETSSSDQLASEKVIKGNSGSLETQVFTLTQKVRYLESKLEEARAVLQAKELRICELETSVNSSRSRKEESDKYREMEFELEGLFQQKMEAEIEFVALSRAVQKLRVCVGNQITLFEEQTSLAEVQAQMLNKLGEAESKAAMLKKQAEELEEYCGDVLGTEEVLKTQRRICKVTSCFFTQLVLLLLVFLFLVLHLSPTHSGVVVPT